jgi:hypothetical protein
MSQQVGARSGAEFCDWLHMSDFGLTENMGSVRGLALQDMLRKTAVQ